MQNSLAVKKIDYCLVPAIAETIFESQIWGWYEDSCQKTEDLPYIKQGMVLENTPARDWLLLLLNDIGDYLYGKDYPELSASNEFPVNKWNWPDNHFQNVQGSWIEKQNHLETLFYLDMQRVMDAKKLFYVENYNFDGFNFITLNRPRYYNSPFGEVW